MSNNSNRDRKRQIKIYQRTYSLPVLGGGKLDSLQAQIRSGSQNLQRGYIEREQSFEEKAGFFGKKIVKKVVKQELKFEDRFVELDKLVKNYDAVIETLQTHQGEYQEFFENLADEIREIVTRKCADIANVEKERLEFERIARQENDDDLLQIAASQKSQILETAKAIGYAAILMLKKLDLMSASLEKIANDQQTQRDVLESMVKKLSVQKRAYEIQLKINRLQAEAAELTKIALNFENYMESFLGSFQTLLGNVAKVDKDLSGAMNEIKQIAEMAMSQQTGNLPMDDRSSQNILDFLVASDLKKERLLDALENSRNANGEVEFDYRLKSASAETTLDVCLENIQTYVQHQLSPVLEAKKAKEEQKHAAAELRLQQEAQLALQRQQELRERSQVLFRELNLELVDIPAGSFMMGSNDLDSEKNPHQVTLRAFQMSKYPITQKQYRLVMGTNPSLFRGDENCPVEQVSWHDAMKFCQELSKKIGQKVKLPSEAQWEYACRAGSTGKYCFGDDVNQLEKYAWYNKNSGNKTHPVGEKLANSWGLHDMHGNVFEWCEDMWHENYNGAPPDGTTWLNGGDQLNKRAVRGGSLDNSDIYCRSAIRGWFGAKVSDYYNGFRVVV
jgi:formylglycine-generating enzyme required for sulfatase activity